MKTFLTTITAVVLTLALGGSTVRAQSCEETTLINGWYQRYLNRPADIVGLTAWTQKLRCAGPEATQAGILASDEFFCRAGHTPEGFVASLYAQVLGRPASGCEVNDWARRLRHCGDRERLALDFLVAARAELAQRIAPVPAFATAFGPRASAHGGVRVQVRYGYIR